MTDVQKTPPASANPPQLSETLQITWEMLGLRRWLPRSAIGRAIAVSAPDAPVARTSRPEPAARQAGATSVTRLHQSTPERVAPVAPAPDPAAGAEALVPIGLPCGSLFDFPECSVLKAERSRLLWVLPPLYPGEDGYRPFKSADEAELLANALAYVALAADAALFRACAEVTVLGAPRFSPLLVSGGRIIPSLRGKTLVLCGSAALRMATERFLDDNAAEEVQMVGCIHPALALRSARGKYRLWTDLERIKGK